MKGCARARRRMLLAADGRLALEETFLLEAHTAECASCAARHAELRAIEEGFEDFATPAAFADVDAAVRRVRERLEATDEAGAAVLPAAAPGPDPVASPRRFARVAVALLIASLAAGSVYRGLIRPRLEDSDAARDTQLAADARSAAPTFEAQTEPGARPTRPAPRPATKVAGVGERTSPEATSVTGPKAAAAPGPVAGPVDQSATEPERSVTASNEAERYADVLERWRVRLARAAGGPLTELESLERELLRAGWSPLRLSEALFDDPDLALACAAIQHVGARAAAGGRTDLVAVAALRRVALQDPEGGERRRAALLAAGELGREGVGILRAVLADGTSTELALEGLRSIGGAAAATAIEDELVRAVRKRAAGSESADLARALASCGPGAVASFLRLEAQLPSAENSWLSWLERVDGARQELGRIVTEEARQHDERVLFRALRTLQPPAALPFIEAACADDRSSALALATLAEWRGPAAWAALVRLDVRSRLADELLVATAATALQNDTGAAVAYARELLARDAAPDVERLLSLLLATERPEAAPALVELALSDRLPPDARQWAALAVGQSGDATAAQALGEELPRLRVGDARLHAACVIAIHALSGERGLRQALGDYEEHEVEHVLALLDDGRTNPRPANLHRVVRALEHPHSPTASKRRRQLP